MSLSVIPEERKAQVSAINYGLATAPDIQEDLKAKFGYGENMFFDLDLVEYRMHNSLEDIAEDLDLEERYNLINDQPISSVSRAFRGYNGKDFPEHKFGGLLSKVTNDYIAGIRQEEGGRVSLEKEVGIHAQTPEELSKARRNGGQISKELGVGIHAQTPEERIELARNGGLIGGRKTYELEVGIYGRTSEEKYEDRRKGGLARRGSGKFQKRELLEDIVNFREESIGKGYHKTHPSWGYITSKMNEKHDEDWSTQQIKDAYLRNK